MGCMTRQLSLLDTPPEWKLDEATRALGRKGVAEARASLREALARQTQGTNRPARQRTAA
jgi:hypothetical protein